MLSFSWLKTLGEILTCWRLPRKAGNPDDAQVGIALSFGNCPTNLSNKYLANVAKALQREYNLQLILQQEVFCAGGYGLRCFAVGHPSHGYLNTFDVLRVAADICRLEGWTKVALICHPAHYWRVELIAKKLGLEVVFAANTAEAPYAPDDPQVWVHNAQWWRAREFFTRFLFLSRRWLSIN